MKPANHTDLNAFVNVTRDDILDNLKLVTNPTVQRKCIILPMEYYNKGVLSINSAIIDYISCAFCLSTVQRKYGWFTVDNIYGFAVTIIKDEEGLSEDELVSRISQFLAIFLLIGCAGKQFKTVIPETLRFEFNDTLMNRLEPFHQNGTPYSLSEERMALEDPNQWSAETSTRARATEAIRTLLSYLY